MSIVYPNIHHHVHKVLQFVITVKEFYLLQNFTTFILQNLFLNNALCFQSDIRVLWFLN
jgi:hypothetical protein